MSRLPGAVALLLAPLPALAGGVGPAATAPAIAPVAVAPIAVAEPCCFDGVYLGAQLAQGTGRAEELGLPDGSGMLWGGHVGYARSVRRVVLGGEIDVMSGNVQMDIPGGVAPDDFIDLDRLMRARVRVGYDLGKVMPYVSAGAARAHIAEFTTDFDLEGSVYTFGVEYCLNERLTLGAELSQHHFEEWKIIGGTAYPYDLQTVDLRASWHF